MADTSKKKLRLATIVYWILLVYIIAALVWWAILLIQQSDHIYSLQLQALESYRNRPGEFAAQLRHIEDERRRTIAKYVGEGAAFLLLICVGAFYIYRSVRSQFRAQQQQQNLMMAITHELKTPIAVSRLNLETLQKYALDEEKREKLLQVTLQENQRLDTLINNILIAAQLEGNSYRNTREELDLSALVKAAAAQFSNRYPDRKLHTEITEGLELTGDPFLLKLLFSNLLENAHKYAPRETSIWIRLRQEAGIIGEVADEGPGIPPEERKNIFRKFYRIGNEQTRKAPGTGLGLYLCQKIAADHRGRIEVRDHQPAGSNFTVYFPSN